MATAKRKETEKLILDYIAKIVIGEENVNLYKQLFSKMTDVDFHKFMEDLRADKLTLPVIIPTGSNIKIDVENNIKLAKELGYSFFQQLEISEHEGMPGYITPEKYFIIKLPIKRAAQLLSKGISIPEDNKSIDMMSGQVTGKSKSSKLTMPELQILIGLGLKDSIVELMKTRGGDAGEGNALNNILYKQGKVSQKLLREFSTGVTSSKTLDAMFNAAHIRTTIKR